MRPVPFPTGSRGTGAAGCPPFQVVVRPVDGAGMDDDTLQALVRGAAQAQEGGGIHFTWQGGEPMQRGLDFFRRAVALQREHAPGHVVHNTLHTGGALVDDAWAAFLAASGFGVTLHVDGPPGLHAALPPQGDPLLACAARLKEHGVEFETCTAVSAVHAQHPLAVYRYLKEAGVRQMQFVPLVEPREACATARPSPREVELSRRTVGSIAYGRFLTSVFAEWIRHDVGRVFVHLFDSTLQAWLHGRPSVCSFAETCACKLAVAPDGAVYACERYLDDAHRLGSLAASPLPDLLARREGSAFGEAKRDTLSSQCRRCDVLAACRGGCPSHRFLHAATGGPGVNYLCAGYRHFFRTVAPHMRAMGALLRQGRPASDVMRFSPR